MKKRQDIEHVGMFVIESYYPNKWRKKGQDYMHLCETICCEVPLIGLEGSVQKYVPFSGRRYM